METVQNIIILILLIITVWLYFDRKNLKYLRDWYEIRFTEVKELYVESKSKQDASFCKYLEIEEKLNKAEEIISQQKQELLTRKTKKR